MEAIYLNPENLNPGITLDRDTNKFKIFGTACPMNGFEFFDPIINWFDNYIKDPLNNTILDLNLSYYNTVSSKFLLKIMSKLEELKESGHDAKIRWFYSEEDEDMREEAEEFENILDIDFEIISLENEDQETEEDDDFFSDMLDDSFLN